VSRAKDALRQYVRVAKRLRRDWPTVTDLAWSQPRSFSLFGEDRYLIHYFDQQLAGFYVDVGAFHPFFASNTYLLYRRGWHGINLEPAPAGVAALRRHRPRDINLPIAVASAEGSAVFRLAGEYAGIADDQYLWGAGGGDLITVATRTLGHVLDEHLPSGQPIDVLDVDCEGRDLDVLRSNDWLRYRPRLILAEAHSADEERDLTAFLQSVDYVPLTQLQLTLVFENARA
jgi:FkbM family methyltransferase